MPEVQPLRSSEALRNELAQLDLDLSALDGLATSQEAQIRLHALSARRGDPKAVKAIADCEAKKRSIEVEKSHAAAARVLLDEEIQAALQREERERLNAAADEQDRAAEAMEPLGQEVDD